MTLSRVRASSSSTLRLERSHLDEVEAVENLLHDLRVARTAKGRRAVSGRLAAEIAILGRQVKKLKWNLAGALVEEQEDMWRADR